tara:strand:- start:227 stop:484 length:258 start_codon:yes stop_codon:yes gene_type:complete
MNETDSVIVVSTKKELISQGYLYTNVNKEFMYEGNLFLLKQHGIRCIPKGFPMFGYSKSRPKIVPRNPIWILQLNDLRMEITNLI